MINILKIDDYVEGYEHYGNITQKMRGWVNKIYENGDVYVQCDDWFYGHRGSYLIVELGEIKIVPKKENWWIN